MKPKILKIIALLGVVAFVLILWPIFIKAETSLAIIFVALSGVGIGIAALALFGRKKWMLWAALGVWPGAIVGGLIAGGIGFATIQNGTTGWEGAIVAVVIIFGTFVGGVAGAVAGGVLGARRARRAA
jgi:hypothetical protein